MSKKEPIKELIQAIEVKSRSITIFNFYIELNYIYKNMPRNRKQREKYIDKEVQNIIKLINSK